MVFDKYIIKINFISFFTIIRKEISRVIRIWPQTILPSIVTSFLYFFIFGDLIGKKIGIILGYDYMSYIIPGLIIMALINTSYTNVVSSFFGSKFQRSIEEILISPTYNIFIILGFLSGGFFRSFFVSFFIYLVSLYFCKFYIYNLFILLFSAFLTIFLFSLLGFINGFYAKKFDDVSIIPTFILTPLIYFGGVFYSLDLLPFNFKFIVLLNPIFYIVNMFRYSFLGISEINIFLSFFIILIFIFIFFIFSIHLFKKGLR